MFERIPRIENTDGTVKHIVKEGARFHVLSWDTNGTHCSEPNCEINKDPQEELGDEER